MRKHGELVERSFAHARARAACAGLGFRGRENIAKRYLIHVADFNLGVLMRALTGRGTPKEAADAASGLLWIVQTDEAWAIILFVPDIGGDSAFLMITVAPDAP